MWLLKKDVAQRVLPKYYANLTKSTKEVDFKRGISSSIESDIISYNDDGTIASIEISGLLLPEGDFNDFYSIFETTTTYQSISSAIGIVNDSESVQEVILDINSPGGHLDGLMPALQSIKDSNKPTTAVVHDMAASAAYMLASQSDKILALHELSSVGSVGVAVTMVDDSEYWNNLGIQIIDFTNTDSKDKRIDIKTDHGKEIIQHELDENYYVLENKIALGRQVTKEYLRDNFGAGAMFIAKEALSNKMIDGIINGGMGEVRVMFNNNNEGVQAMDIEKDIEKVSASIATAEGLRKKYSDLVASIEKEATEKEQERVSEWLTFISVDSDTVTKSIKEGAKLSTAMAATLAVKLENLETVSTMVTDNPEDIPIGVSDDNVNSKTSVGKSEEDLLLDGLSPEQKQAVRNVKKLKEARK